MDGFFFDGRTATSTSEVRAHYGTLRRRLLPRRGHPARRRGARGRPGGTASAAVAPLDPAGRRAPRGRRRHPRRVDGRVRGPGGRRPLRAAGARLGLAGLAFAALWRDRVDYGLRDTPWFLVPAGILMVLGWAVVGDAVWPLDAISRAVAGTGARGGRAARWPAVLVVIGCVSAIFANARSRDSAAGLALRKRLAAARAYFERELERPRARAARRVVSRTCSPSASTIVAALVRAVRGAEAPRSARGHAHEHERVVLVRLGDGRGSRRPHALDAAVAAPSAARAPRPRGRRPRTRSRPASRPGAGASAGSGGDSGGSSGWRSGGGSSSGSSGGGSRSGGGGGGGW